MAPARLKLTQPRLAELACPPGRSEQFFWDAELPGFGVRALAGGKRVWVVQYRTRVGRTRRESLGDLRVVKLEQARTAARNKLAAAQLGADPQSEAKAARMALTARALFDRYLTAAAGRQRPRSLVEAERALLKHAKPLHPMKVCEIGRRDIVEVLQGVAGASGPTSANRVRAHLSAAWTWGLRAGECEGDNPVAFTPRPAPESARDRVLSDAELALIWQCTSRGSDYDRIVRLLMLTAARREEVGGMTSGEVSLRQDGRGLWAIPKARSKNGREHELPLTDLAVAQLPPAGKRALLFGREDETSFSGWSAAKARLDRAMERELTRRFKEQEGRDPTPGEVVLRPWRLHDLRRTFATWSNENGFAPHIVEAVLNHVSGARAGVAGVYNHAGYREQKAAALSAWAAHVSRMTCHPTNSPMLPKAANDLLPPEHTGCAIAQVESS